MHVWIQRGGGGAGGQDPPLEYHKNIGFLAISGLDPLKIVKLPSQLSNLGHNWHGSKTPFKWRFAGRPKMAR